jgi:hypothetical protein
VPHWWWKQRWPIVNVSCRLPLTPHSRVRPLRGPAPRDCGSAAAWALLPRAVPVAQRSNRVGGQARSSAHSLTLACTAMAVAGTMACITVAAMAVPASAVPQHRGRILVQAPMDHGLGVHVSGLASSISISASSKLV